MKVTVEWLKEYVATEASAEEIGATLTMLGLELEEVETSEIGPVLNFKVTPNRGDCLSVLGLARELAAKDMQRFRPTPLMTSAISGFLRGDENQSISNWKISIDNATMCPRYAVREFENVNIKPSSVKLQKRLIACGMRPINVIVDITNAVMLELGQPLHAFDADKIANKQITVRTARTEESLTTLDGQLRKLTQTMLMICDFEKPMAIAGVMGGANSEVSDSTKNILLESAHFEPTQVRATRKSLGMSTEASYRFERFVDPDGVVRSLNRFSDLFFAEIGVDCLPGICDINASKTTQSAILVRENRWNKLLGMDVPKASAATILTSLGFAVVEKNDNLETTSPSWRSDINREDDLVEEIGRVWGYEHIPEVAPTGTTPLGRIAPFPQFLLDIRNTMLRLGMIEALTHTLGAESDLSIPTTRVEIRNPASPELYFLRSSILPGIANVARKNRGSDLSAFEIGNVFHGDYEFPMLGILMHGSILSSHWEGEKETKVDFYSIKGVLESLANIIHRNIEFSNSDDPRLHPTRRAKISNCDIELGIVGQINPNVADREDIPKETMVAEIDLLAIYKITKNPPTYTPISHYPSMRRDMAIVVSKEVPYASIENEIRSATGTLLEDIWLFDRYEGKGMDAGKHSLAIALVLRMKDGTLTDEDANKVLEDAWSRLQVLGAKQRS